VLPAVERTEKELHSLAQGESGRLHITIECHACFEWLLPTLERYRRDWPAVEVDIRLGMSFAPLPALTRGEIDLVITSDAVRVAGVCFEEMFAYEARLAVARDHPLAGKAFVDAVDLAAETLITYPVERSRLDVFRRFLQPAGVEPAAVRQAELTSMILQLVAVRQGVAVLPDWALREAAASGRLATCALGAEGMHGMLYAAVREHDVTLPYVTAFISLARTLNSSPGSSPRSYEKRAVENEQTDRGCSQ
jgi:LysR family transcriptional regulator for metE and metH